MPDWDDDEGIGYGNPPKWTRFRKGESGNPKGRPRKKKQNTIAVQPQSELDQFQRRVFDRKINLSEGGKSTEVKISEAILKSRANQALKGNSLAQRDAIRDLRELEAREAMRAEEIQRLEAEAEAEKLASNERVFDYLVDLKESRKKEWAEALAEGKEEPDFPWPHPDDILLDRSQRKYRVRGPIDGTGVSHFEWVRAERDVAFMKVVLLIASEEEVSQAMLRLNSFMFWHFDALLPRRWQIGDGFDDLVALHLHFDIHELEAMLERDNERAVRWKALSGNDQPSKETYKIVNEVMKPLLKPQGYRSLAQFERAYEDTDGNPPWPRRGG